MYEELTARYVHEAGGILPDQPPWPISAIISLLPPIPHHPLAYKRFMSQRLEWRLSAEEVAFVGLATIIITLMRVICFKTVFAKIARILTLRERDYTAFHESLWQMCFYFPVWVLCSFAVLGQDFFWMAWLCWEEPFPHQPITMPMWWVYMLQIAWYIHCTYAHVFLDKYKKDFWAMFIHHVVTLALVYFAYVGGYYRVGLLVFWSFDICDVFLHLSKAHRYIVNVRSLPDPYKLFLFAMVPVTWLLFRIIFFPWKVLTTAFAYSIMYGGWANVSAWGLFNSLLGILTLLQFFWFWLILKIAWAFAIRGEDPDDVRDPSVDNGQRENSKER